MHHCLTPTSRLATGSPAIGFIACASCCSFDSRIELRNALIPLISMIDDAIRTTARRPAPMTVLSTTCKPTMTVPARLIDKRTAPDQAAPESGEAKLVRVNRELEARIAERTAALERALEDRELLLRELDHRVKNNLQVVSSILGLQSGQTGNLDARRQLRDAQSRVTALGVVHDLLHGGHGVGRLDIRTLLTRLALGAIEIFDPLRERISLDIDVLPLPIRPEQAIPLSMLVSELLTNALKHAFPHGRPGTIGITMRDHTEATYLSVADNGIGLAVAANTATGPEVGLGRSIIAEFARSLDGEVFVETRPGAGTIATLVLPPGSLGFASAALSSPLELSDLGTFSYPARRAGAAPCRDRC